MAKIMEIKSINDNKNRITIEVTNNELGWLEGKMDKMHIFSEENLKFKARLVKRGKRDSTKYFLLPKEFRKTVMPSDNINSNVIETKTKALFIFEVNKY